MPELRDYQKEGAAFLMERDNAILADQMGLGKTIQVLSAFSEMNIGRKENVLIVCPASLKRNWEREMGRWWPDRIGDVSVLDGRRNTRVSPISIINYDILQHNLELIQTKRWAYAVADEAHYVKEASSQRTRALLSISAGTRWTLTGTPVLNRPMEFYPPLWWLRQKLADDKQAYALRYCGAFYDAKRQEWNYRGASNIEELRDHLREIMLRRLKADVLSELPPKIKQRVELNISASAQADIYEQQRAAGNALSIVFAHLEQGSLKFGNVGDLAALRASLGRAKIEGAVHFVKDLLEETDEKVVVFAHHAPVIAGLMAGLAEYKAVKIDGSVPPNRRLDRVDKLEQDPDCRVLVGNIQAAGEGLNMTKAATVVFVEYDWVPGKNEQAEDRTHRFGQQKAVNIFYLAVNRTIDGMIADVLVTKENTLSPLLGASRPQNKPPTKGKNTMSNEYIAAAHRKVAEAHLALALQLDPSSATSEDMAGEPVAATPVRPAARAIARPVTPVRATAPAARPVTPARPVAPARAAKAAPVAAPAPEEPEYTMDDVKEAANNYSMIHGLDATIDIAKGLGAERLIDIPKSKFKEAIDLYNETATA